MASQYASGRSTPLPVSVAAARVADDIHSDSGYGGSVRDGDDPMNRPVVLGNPLQNDAQWASHVRQMAYNQNRSTLGRHVNKTMDMLKGLQKTNAKHPALYPAVQQGSLPSLQRTQSTLGNGEGPSTRPQPLRRAATSLHEHTEDSDEPSPEPRLVARRIAEEFNVLKLDLKLGSKTRSVHSLEKTAIASLLDDKITQSVKHLFALRDRIDDIASKVLITGDLNAGKSTFCNALLRRRVLPEDQQPCTSTFCEVLDARENGGVEEVHAIIGDGPAYNRHDETTFEVFPLDKLEEIVVDNDKYHICKVYVEDYRTIDQSLLRNGVVDIALIDAPGLNTDSIKTTNVFARQEEIDVVVFVVNAENHFTQSAKEFIFHAANEKAYVFIVVNKFDNIRDKARCRRLILEQVAALSPRTYQDASELVHFVSANAVIDGEEPSKTKDFETLETSLRSFVLDKRARSKLAPAKTYLYNLLGDIETLAFVNHEAYSNELSQLASELEVIAPAFENAVKARTEVNEEVEKSIEDTTNDVYRYSRKKISTTIAHVDDAPSVPYDGLLSVLSYADATKQAMLSTIQNAVAESEQYSRDATTEGVASIGALGVHHLGKDYNQMNFRSELMFTRKRHQLHKDINISVDVTDFFDLNFDRSEKLAGAGMSLTVATVASSQLLGISSWLDGLWKATNLLGVRNTRKLILPALAFAAAVGGYIVLSDLPNAVPRKLAKKIRKQLTNMDYVHANSDRIAKETRKVLNMPVEDLRAAFQRSVETQKKTVEEKMKGKKDSEQAQKYFGGLMKEAKTQRVAVQSLDLENHPNAATTTTTAASSEAPSSSAAGPNLLSLVGA